MRLDLVVTTLLLLASVGSAQKPVPADTWEPLRYFIAGDAVLDVAGGVSS